MQSYTLPLASAQADLPTAGGKGLSLAKMLAAGLPVPEGFHVTTAAYRDFVRANALQAQIQAALSGLSADDPAGLEAASRAIAGLFESGAVPAEIEQAVTSAYHELGAEGKFVAVRSSATAEDLPDASFAGQQETYLNIRGTGAVLDAVRKCWASLWTARAIAYRLKNAIDQDEVALAVVVQQMVAADCAGILFTANPVNGSRGEALINAAWGLGEAVVSGSVTPDTLTVAKENGKVLKRETAEKLVMTVRAEGGVREQPVPANLRKRPVLSNRQAAELAAWGVKIEQFYGRPMDIEWAYAGGKFYLLQARPITALPAEWKPVDPKAIYARGSLAEHIPSPVTPLFATLGLELANAATEAMWRRILDNDSVKLIPPGGFYQPINGYIFGGMYMRGADLIPIMRMSLSQVGPMFRGSVQRWQQARERFTTAVEPWEDKTPETLSASELLEGASILFGAACRFFTDIQTTLPAASSSETVFTVFYNRLARRKNDPEASVFMLGSETASLRADKSLFDLAEWLRQAPELAAYVLQTPPASLLADLAREQAPAGLPQEGWADWRKRFDAHRQTFGRAAYEFDFAQPTPLETPGPMLEALKGFLSGKVASPYARQAAALHRREVVERAVHQRLIWPFKGWFNKLLAWAQETAPMREDAIFDMGMAHPLIRELLGELGRRLTAGGAIETPKDIYWLEKGEVEPLIAALEAGQPLADHAGLVQRRKATWEFEIKLTPPTIIPERSGWSKMMHGGEAQKIDGKTVLSGVGTSGGVVTAPARVIYGPEDFGRMQPGDVLVAVTTTPSWTPLFVQAAGVVTDIGGPLSHSSIVAREYGIPAVMAARKATQLIRDGQMVTVDGSAGRVILEE